jgi:hypothetical protein
MNTKKSTNKRSRKNTKNKTKRRNGKQTPQYFPGPGPYAKATQKEFLLRRGARLGVCARDFGRSLLNPFDPLAAVCMPDTCGLPSRKVTYFSKGTFSTNSTGFGFICFNPFRAAYTTAVAGQMALRTTAGGFLGTAIDTNSATVGVTSTQPNSSDSLGSSGAISYRLVNAGIRVRFGGTALNRGGRFSGVEHPSHENLNGTNTAGINNFDSSRQTVEEMNDWFNVVYSPKYPIEMSYTDIASEPSPLLDLTQTIAASASTLQGSPYCLGITCDSAVATQLIIYEAFASFETLGSTVHGKTPSYIDPPGYGAVVNSAGLIKPFYTKELGSLSTMFMRDVMMNLSMQSSSGG